VHERGWRILGDLTTNHTGDTHEWFRTAQGDPESATRSYYYFDEDGSYADWMGFATLPKINHGDPDLRSAMVEGPDSVVGRWLRPPYDVDGWRIDVANMTGRLGALDVAHDVARAIRRTAESLREDPFVIGEHNHDASGDVDGDGWHGTMNYSGFSWPVWSWLRSADTTARAFGRPVQVARRSGPAVVEMFRAWQGALGWRATTSSWNILGSHDSARIRTLVGGDSSLHRVAAGLQFTMPGVPMLFAGDELGLEGVTGEDSRRTMPWDSEESWDSSTLAAYAELARVRRSRAALRRGGQRWAHVDDDTIAFVREHADGSVLVVARRAAGPGFALRLSLGDHVFGSEPGSPAVETAGDTSMIPSSDGPRLDIWTLG
jgi:alpha-glucosidase